MKKSEIIKRLKAFGVTDFGRKTVAELRKALDEAEADGTKPGHNISKGPQPGDRI